MTHHHHPELPDPQDNYLAVIEAIERGGFPNRRWARDEWESCETLPLRMVK